MSTAKDKIDALVEAARFAGDIQRELGRLRDIEAWALSQIAFKEGDPVVIRNTFPAVTQESGWWPHRGHLIPGATGFLRRVYFYKDRWCVYYEPEVEWIVHSGYALPKMDRVWHPVPADKRKLFAFNLDWVRHRLPNDVPLALPPDTSGRSDRAYAI